MAEARRLKTGRWRLYKTPELYPLRDPATGNIATFGSLGEARRWWLGLDPKAPSLQEALKCANCGAYFGRNTTSTSYGGRYYHPSHTPQAVDGESRRSPI
jgi:hypothetical protein